MAIPEHRRHQLRATSMLALLVMLVPTLRAADYIVDFDHQVDFSSIRTFALRGNAILLDRPEIKSQLVQQQITAAIRAALTSRGLRETAGDADVVVDWKVSGQRFAINEWNRAIPLDNVPGEMRVPPGNPWRNLPEAFVEGVLTVDLSTRSPELLIWRGVYRNKERGSGQVAHQLPEYAKKLLATYPPRRK